jgi:hypothetical protein
LRLVNREIGRVDPDEIYAEMTAAADQYASDAYVADLAEIAADNAIDRAMLALRDGPGPLEMKRAEARSSRDAQEAAQALAGAKKTALASKLRWQALTTKLDFLRSLESSLRAQAVHVDRMRG